MQPGAGLCSQGPCSQMGEADMQLEVQWESDEKQL